jgi:predicted DNA-binding transcriptional regulator AlpA
MGEENDQAFYKESQLTPRRGLSSILIFSAAEVFMQNVPKNAEGTRFLSGWKEIASYLGKGVRTIQRYERELGFPVRRPAGKSHAAVIATRAEVDAWVAASPIREEFRLSARKPGSETISLDDLRKKVVTMGLLRDEMIALRAELRTSVKNLAESIEGIHWGIGNHWGTTEIRPSFSELGGIKRRMPKEYAAEGLTRDTTRGKAS